MKQTSPLAVFLFLMATVFPGLSIAQRFPVDDSASQVLASHVSLKSERSASRAGEPILMSGGITVLARLNVSQWVGQKGRIHMILPSRPGGSLVASWTTRRGILLPGRIQSGERALVYSGPITSSLIEDTIWLTVAANSETLNGREQLEFSFEIELEPN